VITRKKMKKATGRPSGNEWILEIERGSIRSPSVEKSLEKRLRDCLKTDYGMNECDYCVALFIQI
jgi:hypothetical protein